MKNTLLINGPISSQSGYGARTRDLTNAILKLDRYDISIVNGMNWGITPEISLPVDIEKLLLPTREVNFRPNILVTVSVPNEFTRYTADFRIGVTAGLECNRVSPQWVNAVNSMDLTLVSSNFSKNTFIASTYSDPRGNKLQVEKPVEVLFEGVDTSVYKEQNFVGKSFRTELQRIPEDFLFLCVGTWLPGSLGEDRKNIGATIYAFTAAFENSINPPALLLKSTMGGLSYYDIDMMLSRIKMIQGGFKGKVPNVYLLYGDMTDEEMNQLYNWEKVKCYVSLTHGEGYGRPLAEATQSSKPIIAPKWSGQLDFLKHAILLDGELVDVPASDFIIPNEYSGQGVRKWFQPDMDKAIGVMRNVHSNYNSFLKEASKQQSYVKNNLSLYKMEEEVKYLFDRYVPKTFDKIEIPWRGL